MTPCADNSDHPSGEPFEALNLTYEWDPNKSESNAEKHSIDFVAATGFEWDTAVVRRSDRHGETRFVAYGYIERRVHVLVFTLREDRIRIISLRKANDLEERYHAEAQT